MQSIFYIRKYKKKFFPKANGTHHDIGIGKRVCIIGQGVHRGFRLDGETKSDDDVMQDIF